MPITRSCAELAARPLALLEALLRRDTSTALRLLEAASGGAASQLALTGPGLHFTALHAAALSGCAEAIPALVAAGVPVDAVLDAPGGSLWSEGAAPLCALLWDFSHFRYYFENGVTALAVAVRAGQQRCVQQLLEAGADPAAGRGYSAALHALAVLGSSELCAGMLPPFLQRGLDPLQPLVPHGHNSLLVSCCPGRAAELLLDHLEQQRAAGALHLGSWQRAQQLLLGVAGCGAADGRYAALLGHAIAELEQLHRAPGSAGGAEAEPAIPADEVQQVLAGVVKAGQAAALRALLASRLPFDVRAEVAGEPLLHLPIQSASVKGAADAAACVRLLLQAGAVVTACDLYTAVDRQSPAAMAALLSCGAPAVDVSEPEGPDGNWSCPIHRALHAAMRNYHCVPTVKVTAQVLEALTAAGFRPAIYRHARLPAFLGPSPDAAVFAELDPLALLDTAHPQHAQLSGAVWHWAYSPEQRLAPAAVERLLHLARGGGWSPAAHRLWPDSFKAAARTLLLCASISSGWSSGGSRRVTRAEAQRHPQRSPNAAARLLGGLPQGVLLHVVRLAAEPMSAWL